MITFFPLMGFTFLNNKIAEATLLTIIAGAGSAIAYFIFKNQRYRKSAAIIVFCVIFFGTQYYGLPYYYAANLDSDLRQQSLFRIIAAYYPKEYNEYIEIMKKNIIYHEKVENLYTYTSAITNYATAKSEQYASTKAIYNYAKASHEFNKKIYTINPELVLARKFPSRIFNQPLINVFIEKISPSDVTALQDAQADLIHSGSTNNKITYSSDAQVKQALDKLAQIMAALIYKHGKDTIENTFTTTIVPFENPTVSAQILLAFDELILKRNEEEAVILWKTVYMWNKDNNHLITNTVR